MLLRSGRVITHKMPDDAASTSQSIVVHKVTNICGGITNFKGLVDGKPTQNIETFIESVNNYLNSKKITNGAEALTEAKSFLDLDKGDIGKRARSFGFRRCKTWNELQKFLRATYGGVQRECAVRNLREFLKIKKGNDSLVTYSANLFDAVVELKKSITGSPWVTGNNISLDNFERLLHFACLLTSVPDVIVDSFDKRIDQDTDESFLFAQINKNLAKCPTLDSSFVQGGAKMSAAVSKPQNNDSRSHSGNDATAKTCARVESKKIPERSVTTIRCFNCDKIGHSKSNCRVRYCSVCKSSDHGWRFCPATKSRDYSGKSRGGFSRYDRRIPHDASSRYTKEQQNFHKISSKTDTG